MNPMIPELRHKLDKFKSWIEMPRFYVVEEYSRKIDGLSFVHFPK